MRFFGIFVLSSPYTVGLIARILFFSNAASFLKYILDTSVINLR
jgi:hypothetical protein